MQIFGDFIQQFPPEKDSLELTFTPTSIPLRKRWRNNRLSAYFIADYFTTFLPLDDGDTEQQKRIEESKSAVSYIANELLENAMKYNDENSHSQIEFGIHFLDKNNLIAVIFATNSIKSEDMKKLQDFIGRLSSENPEFLYMEQLEKNALNDLGDDCSGLGFLTIINDYGGKMGWKFDSIEPFNIVTTMVQIQV
jgi:hypothetical protein